MTKILYLIMLLISTFAMANQIVARDGGIVTVMASGEYIMGDSDNRKEARNMALTQAKTNASEVAGTYIESNFESISQQMHDGVVNKITKKELKSFSAAILQSEITKDTMEMLSDKSLIYKVDIIARIDLATLRERVKQLGEDKAKKERLVNLEKENADLSLSLLQLSEKMKALEESKSVKFDDIKALRDERERLFTKIEKNEGETKLVFEKGSIKSEYDQKVEIAKNIYETVDNTVYKHIANFITYHFDKPTIVDKDGDEYLVRIKYEYKVDKNKLANALKPMELEFDSSGGNKYIVLDVDDYDETLWKLLKQLCEGDGRNVSFIFSLAGSDEEIKIGEMSGVGDSYYAPIIIKGRLESNSYIDFWVTQEQLAMMNQVEARIVVSP